jgi:hypothetical protein
LPRHFTLAGALAIGIPAFFLALAPSTGAFRIGGFIREVARFAVPAGVAAGAGVVASYLFARYVLDAPVAVARTVATSVLVLVGLLVVVMLEEERVGKARALVAGLCLTLAGVYALALAVPFARSFFALETPNATQLLTIAAGVVMTVVLFRLRALREHVPDGPSDDDLFSSPDDMHSS